MQITYPKDYDGLGIKDDVLRSLRDDFADMCSGGTDEEAVLLESDNVKFLGNQYSGTITKFDVFAGVMSAVDKMLTYSD